jgi:hypothetical protein
MKLITFVFATLWYFAHAQEELGSSTFLRGGGSGENNVNVELATVEEDVEQTTNNVATNYGDEEGMDPHELELKIPVGVIGSGILQVFQGIFGGPAPSPTQTAMAEAAEAAEAADNFAGLGAPTPNTHVGLPRPPGEPPKPFNPPQNQLLLPQNLETGRSVTQTHGARMVAAPIINLTIKS